MSGTTDSPAVVQNCWNRIGVWGDVSCPELTRVGHCRNCEVYSAGGRQLLERAAPDDYLDQWTTLIGEAKASETKASVPYLAFRVGRSWFAVRAQALRELTPPGVVRTVPHQRSDVLLGLTSVRGEIVLCFSLHVLLGEPRPETAAPSARFLVLRYQAADWVFPVDDVSGVYEIAVESIEPLPATMTMAGGIYTTGIAKCGEHPAGLIDEELLVRAIGRKIA